MPITTGNITHLIAIIMGIITIGSVIIKVAFTVIDLKWKIGSKDFITLPQLNTFCLTAQARCPKAIELNQFTNNVKYIAETLKEVVDEQKKLRQETLPEKYVNMGLFKDTVERIERSLDKAVDDMKQTADNIYKRINEIK